MSTSTKTRVRTINLGARVEKGWSKARLERDVVGREALFVTFEGEQRWGRVESVDHQGYAKIRFSDGKWARADRALVVR